MTRPLLHALLPLLDLECEDLKYAALRELREYDDVRLLYPCMTCLKISVEA